MAEVNGDAMGIVLARVDNRLIHGQIIESWVPALDVDCIVVANNQLATVAFQKTLMEAAVPRGIRVSIGSVEEMADRLKSGELEAHRILLLFASPRDALRAYRMGILFQELNIGNLQGGKDKLRVNCTVSLTGDDMAQLQMLEDQGVRIVLQCIPSDRRQIWRRSPR